MPERALSTRTGRNSSSSRASERSAECRLRASAIPRRRDDTVAVNRFSISRSASAAMSLHQKWAVSPVNFRQTVLLRSMLHAI